VKGDQKSASDQLSKGKKKEAGGKQKSAAEKMQKMAEKVEEKLAADEEEQLGEDINTLRGVLENLVKLSFSQEDLIKRLGGNPTYGAAYVANAQAQARLIDEMKVIEDSLTALAKRTVEVRSFITKELGLIEKHMGDATTFLGKRFTPQARQSQQYTMTSVNNLAVMLSESLQNMQQQQNEMQGAGSKGGSCSKPGSGKKPGKGKGGSSGSSGKGGKGSKSGSLGKLSAMQKQLGEQLKQMQMKQGNNGRQPGQGDKGQGQQGQGQQGQGQGQNGQPGNAQGGKPGGQNGQGSGSEGVGSSEFAKAAALQEAIRRELQRLADEESKASGGKPGAGNALREAAKQMESQEKDLVNKRLTQEMLRRQQDITTRLLESEQAERQREEDPKRQAEQPEQQPPRNPEAFAEYLRLKEREVELLRSVPLDMNTFYRRRAEQYMGRLGTGSTGNQFVTPAPTK